MKAIEVREHFVSRAPWVDPETTVDRIIIGNPEKTVRRILVTWISSFRAVRAAVEGGFDALMTHEPTFYRHDHEEEGMDASRIASEKKRYILDKGLVIIRNHDVWDKFPEVGIPSSWGRFLELGQTPAILSGDGYMHGYDIEPISLDGLARKIAKKTGELGEPYVQVVGEGGKRVSRVGIGTGCIARTDVYQHMGCDVGIFCDDGTSYWAGLQQAKDEDFPAIRVNHGTSEEPGMVALTEYLNRNLSGIEARHYPHGCAFKLVGE